LSIASNQRGGQFVVPTLAPAVVEGTLVVPAAVVEAPGAVVVVDVPVAVLEVAFGKLLVLFPVVEVAPVVDGVVAAPVPLAVVAAPAPVAVVAVPFEVTGHGFEIVELPVVPLVAGAGTDVVPA